MLAAIALAVLPPLAPRQTAAAPVKLRVATWNLEDVRTADLKGANNLRLRRIAEIIQRIRPNILLLNEIAYDMPGGPDVVPGEPAGQNAQRFADLYLAVPQAPGLAPIKYRAFMAPVNTGVPSGFDLDNDGNVVTTFPPPAPAKPDGSPGDAPAEGRAYGNDCWGFGTFPGQYGMALLIDERLGAFEPKAVRTFQRLPWSYMPGAFLPTNPDGTPFYSEEELGFMRMSSKSHWDAPLPLPNGAVLRLLCSHPTPPAFDGPEMRNRKRNHDEIRFWIDYIQDASYIVDDNDHPGGLERGGLYIILGDLNADPAPNPDSGNQFKDPLGRLFAFAERINLTQTPVADMPVEGLDPSDTAAFKLRVDYVLPSRPIRILGSGVWRTMPALGGEGRRFPSDHYPVWADLEVPAPAAP